MSFTASMRVRINGKNVVVKRIFDSKDSSQAIREVGEEASRLRKAAEVQKKSVRTGFRKKKTKKADSAD